jgi:hypothetical protein
MTTPVERPKPHNADCIRMGCMIVRNPPTARSVDLWQQQYQQRSPRDLTDEEIRTRWRRIEGHFQTARDWSRCREMVIDEADFFAAVRSGKIQL